MAIKLHADTIYHPIRGMDPDSNGISARVDECLFAENVDIDATGVQIRRGTELLGDLVTDMEVTLSTYDSGAFNDDYTFDSVAEDKPKFVADADDTLFLEWFKGFVQTSASATNIPLLNTDVLWFDSGLTNNSEVVYYEPSETYAYWNNPTLGWVFSIVTDVGNESVVNYFALQDYPDTITVSGTGTAADKAYQSDGISLAGYQSWRNGDDTIRWSARTPPIQPSEWGLLLNSPFDFWTIQSTDYPPNKTGWNVSVFNSDPAPTLIYTLPTNPYIGQGSFSGTITLAQDEVAASWVFTEDGLPIYATASTDFYPKKTGWAALTVSTGETVPTLAYTAGQPEEEVVKYHTYIHPIAGTQLFAFCADEIYRLSDTVWEACLNSGVTTYTFNQWSVTNYIDRKVGATVVAAGSSYTRPTEAYVDSSSRVLLYYDPTAGTSALGEFKTLQLYTDQLGDEVLQTLSLPVAPASVGGIVTDTIATASPLHTPLLPGTVFLTVEGYGAIAYAGHKIYDPTGTPYNRLIPIDDSQVVYSQNSFIELETGDVSIELVDDTFDTLDLAIYYTYKLAVTYRPLYVTNYYNALVMANTSELTSGWSYFPWRIRWSEQGDMSAVRELDYQELALDDITPILGMKALETQASSTIVGPLYFYKHNSIIRGTYNQSYNLDPATPVPFLSLEIAFSEGIEAANTITSIEGSHFYLGRNDIYTFDGVNRRSLTRDAETGGTRIQRALFAELDIDKLNLCFSLYDEIARKFMLFIATRTATDYPDKCYVYDLDLGSWVTYRFSSEISAGLVADFNIGGAIQNLLGGIEDLPGIIDDLTSNTTKSVLLAMGGSSYLLTSRNGYDRQGYIPESYDSYWITRDFFGGTLQDQDRIQKVAVEGINGTLTMSHNPYYEFSNFLFEDSLLFGSKYERKFYHPDVVTDNIRFKLDLTVGTKIRWLQVFSQRQEFTNE